MYARLLICPTTWSNVASSVVSNGLPQSPIVSRDGGVCESTNGRCTNDTMGLTANNYELKQSERYVNDLAMYTQSSLEITLFSLHYSE